MTAPATPPTVDEVEPLDHVVWSVEHGAYWAPRCCGYRANLLEAGLYTKAQADAIARNAEPGLEKSIPLQVELNELRAAIPRGGAVIHVLEVTHGR